MKALLALTLFGAAAMADTTITPGSVGLYSGSYVDTAACAAAATSKGPGTYTCAQSQIVTVTAPAPSCTAPKPPNDNQSIACPAGTTGSWNQVRTYSAAAYPTCWSAGPWSPSSAPAGACPPIVVTPPPTGTYPGFTYQLPTARPFISMAAYANGTAASIARLKAQVDDVVSVTNAQGAGATYASLTNALNSNHYGYSPVDSVLMFKRTGNTAYIDQAIRQEDLYVASENARIAGGSAPQIAGDSYLNVGQTIMELALTYDYGYARLTSSQRTAWSALAEQALSNVWNYKTAAWVGKSFPWTGWATDDPGDNYYYSFLKATQLWALASQNQTWFAFLQAKKFPQMVPYFAGFVGGGSREGTGYGTSFMSLFENYQYWKDSIGEDLSALSSHARDSIDYWVHASVPTLQYFAPIGDQARSSMPAMFDYQRRLMLEDVALNLGTAQANRGAWWLAHAQVSDGGTGWVTGQMRYNFDYRYDLLASAGTPQAPTALVYDANGAGVVFARSDWTTNASWMHAVAGIYDQSHQHQDQGSFSFFRNGWLSLTSNANSHSGIHQDTGAENVLRFDSGSTPVTQTNSTSTKTISDSSDALDIKADLSPAYANSGGKVTKWTREFIYTRSTHTLAIHDLCAVAVGVTPVFQVHMPVAPVLQGDGSYLAGKLRIASALPGTFSIVNMKNTDSDYNTTYRLELRGTSCEFQVALSATQ